MRSHVYDETYQQQDTIQQGLTTPRGTLGFHSSVVFVTNTRDETMEMSNFDRPVQHRDGIFDVEVNGDRTRHSFVRFR